MTGKQMSGKDMRDLTINVAYIVFMEAGKNQNVAFLIAMTAAALSGHIVNKTPEEMHEMLDKVMELGEELRDLACEFNELPMQ